MGTGKIMSIFAAISPSKAMLISVCWFSAGVMIHLIICRLTGTQKYMVKGLAFGLLLMLCLLASQAYSRSINIAVLYYTFTLWLAYMMFFVNLLNSVTLKMLDFLNRKGGTLNAKDFSVIFGGNMGINSRLKAIKRNGFLDENAGRLHITRKGKLLTYIIRLLRRVIGITEAG